MGNVTGSNSVNVFLGLGLPWVIASIYYQQQDPPTNYNVPSKGLDLSVGVFLVCSLFAISFLVVRRLIFKGELGGSKMNRTISAVIFATLWFTYIIVSSLAQYGIIKFG